MTSNRSSFIIRPEVAELVIRDAMELSDVTRTDQLNCRVSCARQPTDKTPEQVLRMGLKGKNTFWIFILRDYPRDYADIGLVSNQKGTDYFLWLELSIKNAKMLISKYELLPV